MLTAQKRVNAVIDYDVDFVNNLQSGETLSAPVVTVESASGGVAGDLTIANPQISGSAVRFRSSDGKAHAQVDPHRWETVYCVQVEATTSSGEKESETLLLTTYDCQQVT